MDGGGKLVCSDGGHLRPGSRAGAGGGRSTFASLPLDVILGNQGGIALLQAKGYTVETPE